MMAHHRPTRGWHLYALATVLLVNALFVLNNLAPYFALHHAGAMTMYSGLSASANNHWFMPSFPLADGATYVTVARFDRRNGETRAAKELEAFVRWTRQTRRVVHLNFVRYQLSRVCGADADAEIQLAYVAEDGHRQAFENVCAEPGMLHYALLSGYTECKPGCRDFLQRWAAGLVGED
jgi:hypothetical protein